MTILTWRCVLDFLPHSGQPPSLSFATRNEQHKQVEHVTNNILFTLVKKEASACRLETCTQIFVTSSAEMGPPIFICTKEHCNQLSQVLKSICKIKV